MKFSNRVGVMKELLLVDPQERYANGFKKMVEEYRLFGEKKYFEVYREALDDFNGYVLKLNNNAKGVDLPDGWVPAYTFWLTDVGDEIFGVVRIRTSLNNEWVKRIAGHIGYDISPLSRGKGYGNLLLKLALEKAATIKLDKVLITCSDDNIASKRIIENNGGVFESEIFDEQQYGKLRRYWIIL